MYKNCLFALFFVYHAYVTASTWSTPLDVSPPTISGNAATPQVVVDGRGNAVAVWIFNNTLQAATLPVNSTAWIPTNTGFPAVSASNPQVAVDCAGNAIAIWTKVVSNNFVIQAATLPFWVDLLDTHRRSHPSFSQYSNTQISTISPSRC